MLKAGKLDCAGTITQMEKVSEMEKRHVNMVNKVLESLKIELTRDEESFLNWICRNDDFVTENLISLIKKVQRSERSSEMENISEEIQNLINILKFLKGEVGLIALSIPYQDCEKLEIQCNDQALSRYIQENNLEYNHKKEMREGYKLGYETEEYVLFHYTKK